jgi:hypothetical protein
MSENTTCDKCQKPVETHYKFCPKCGHNMDEGVRADMYPDTTVSIDTTETTKPKAVKFTTIHLISKFLGAILLLLAVIVLIWFSWSSYVGYLVRFNKSIPDTIFSIDGEFFNLTGENKMYNMFLISFILFGLLKTGFWLIKRTKSK